MNHLKINQDNTRTEINVSDNVVEKIYQEVKDYNTHDPSDLSGLIEINRGYLDAVNFLNSNYPRFRCRTLRTPYVRFEDQCVEQYIVNKLYNNNVGDGIGFTMDEIPNVNGTNFFQFTDNTELIKFNELKLMTYYNNIAENSFNGCINLEEIDLSNITNLEKQGFSNCKKLKKLGNTSNITSIGTLCFSNCSSLEYINLQNLNVLGLDGQFYNCSSLKKIILGTLNNIGTRWNSFDNYRKPFYNCINLHTIDIKQLNYIYGHGGGSFGNNNNLQHFILRNENSIPNFSDDATSTSISAFGGSNVKIYVPDNMINVYNTTEGWESVVNYIYPLSEYVPIED